MTKIVRVNSSKSKVLLTGLFGLVFLGLTSYYLYSGYVSESNSSAGNCKSMDYTCDCKDGRKTDIKYNYCAKGVPAYEKCQELKTKVLGYKSELEKLEEDFQKYRVGKYTSVGKKMDTFDGVDDVLNAKECFNAKLCKTDRLDSEGKFTWKTDATSVFYKSYNEAKEKYLEKKASLSNKQTDTNKEITTRVCDQVKAGNETLMNMDRLKRCQKACDISRQEIPKQPRN